MSTLTLASPGVQINEVDLSLLARTTGATNIFAAGFADKGPTDEIVNVGSITEYEDIFGTPTTAAERYLYQSSKQILTQSNGNLLVSRVPYGSASGAGFANSYSALVYPLSTDSTTFDNSSTIYLNNPVSILLTDDQYKDIVAGNVNWSTSVYTASTVIVGQQNLAAFYTNNNVVSSTDIVSYVSSTSALTYYTRNQSTSALNLAPVTGYSTLGNAGLVVLNPSKLAVNNIFEGYYIGIADNSNNNPATDFNCVTGINAVQTINGNTQTFAQVPSARLNFNLTQPYTSSQGSISQVLENFPTAYDFGNSSFNDCLTLVVFKIRSSIYGQDTSQLSFIAQEGYTGSLWGQRKQNSPNGGSPVAFSLQAVANQTSNNVAVLVNPNLSKANNWVNSNGTPGKTVRVTNPAKNLYSQGVYISNTNSSSKDVGNIPAKLARILNNIDTLDIPLDVTIEAGLGTIWASAKARQADTKYGAGSGPYLYDELYNLDLTNLKDQNTGYNDNLALDYNSIATSFVAFAEKTRKDHVFIADPLRHIFVNGNLKSTAKTSYIFSKDIYWTIKNLYGNSVSSYTSVYGNWLLVNDTASNNQVWVPASGWAAAIFAQTAATSFPWSAPAGFNRGALTNVLDLAINPTQKHRDLLYRININPIAYFPGDGYVIYGQKTLFTKPSAFDRINVRRLFLTLEKSTQSVLKYFVFEPNSFTTRSRLVNTLKPIFDQAKNNDGLYDYKIVCDERNNTPNIIDQNQLKVSIYIQPVRTSEFILADFIATQTGVNFDELNG